MSTMTLTHEEIFKKVDSLAAAMQERLGIKAKPRWPLV